MSSAPTNPFLRVRAFYRVILLTDKRFGLKWEHGVGKRCKRILNKLFLILLIETVNKRDGRKNRCKRLMMMLKCADTNDDELSGVNGKLKSIAGNLRKCFPINSSI